jgi:hypothetical protein
MAAPSRLASPVSKCTQQHAVTTGAPVVHKVSSIVLEYRFDTIMTSAREADTAAPGGPVQPGKHGVLGAGLGAGGSILGE